jgi:hypothetical protein
MVNDHYSTHGQMDYHLTLPDDVRLFVRVGGYGNEGRLSVSGSWPKYTKLDGVTTYLSPRDCGAVNYLESPPEITVSADKTPEQIVKDIQRRLLPVLSPIWRKCLQYIIDREHADARRSYTVRRLAVNTGGTPHVENDRASVSYDVHYGRAEYRGGCGGGEPETFKLSLEGVSEDQVAAIMTLLKGNT